MKALILPGLDGTGALHGAFIDQFSEKYEAEVVTYPNDLTGYDALFDWLVDRLPDQDFVIVAESFSGPLAIMIADQAPQSLRGVVWVATFARSPRRLPAVVSVLAGLVPIGSRAMVKLIGPVVIGKWANPAFADQFRLAMRSVPAKTLRQRLRAVLSVDVRERLGQLAIPTVYLQSRHDRLVPARAARDFKAVGTEIVSVAGPHFLIQAQPTEVARYVMRFVKALG